jgi:UDP-N-acetyl-D-glucosamine dehydrogenase
MPEPRKVAIVGAGYVGIPLAQVFAEAGQEVLLVDISAERVEQINRGDSYIEDVPSEALGPLVESGSIRATTDYDELKQVEAIIIALPTPLSKQREPDLTIVMSAAEEIAKRLQPGQMVVLESTTYPGTTRERLCPALEAGSGLRAGKDFYLAFSPERVDPGRLDWTTKTTPKVIGGLDQASTEKVSELYRTAVDTIVEVSSPESAEMTKLLENIFRSVNIALANELAQLCDRMGLDVWEIIDAAATKPFGFMKFLPGPGLGGHCIPIDPFYLSWKAREHNFYTEFIELAGKINENMPYFCRGKIMRALNSVPKPIRGSKILVLGVAYKKDISDMRESPALKVIQLLRQQGAIVSYHDPFVAELPDVFPESDVVPDVGLRSVELEPESYDCVVIVTDHSQIDYEDVADRAKLVVDFRNATPAQAPREGKVWKL